MPHRSGFRPDIEGLRAVAIATVLLCHAGLPFVAGGFVGVDVFFVVSGFLITRLLVGELEETGRISLRRFYARRAKRLLPLTAVVLAFVGAMSLLLLSPVRAVEVSGDIVSSAGFETLRTAVTSVRSAGNRHQPSGGVDRWHEHELIEAHAECQVQPGVDPFLSRPSEACHLSFTVELGGNAACMREAVPDPAHLQVDLVLGELQ